MAAPSRRSLLFLDVKTTLYLSRPQHQVVHHEVLFVSAQAPGGTDDLMASRMFFRCSLWSACLLEL